MVDLEEQIKYKTQVSMLLGVGGGIIIASIDYGVRRETKLITGGLLILAAFALRKYAIGKLEEQQKTQ